MIRRKLATALAMSWKQRLSWLASKFATIAHTPIKRISIVAYFPAALILSIVGVRFLASQGWPSMGQLSHDPQVYIKGVLVGANRRRTAVLVSPSWITANQRLLDSWRDHMIVISNPILSVLLFPFTWTPPVRLSIYVGHGDHYKGVIRDQESGRTLTNGAAADEILRLYDEQYDMAPLISLTPEERQRGRSELAKLGVPAGAWWVCLHVRESGYHGGVSAIRDSDPMTYLEAAQAIVDRGGWVVRIGDTSMSPMPKMEGLIDYVHSSVQSDWMDIFLIEGCRFFLGTDAGPQSVARLLARPSVIANVIPMGHGAQTLGLYLPKIYKSTRDDSFLKFKEVMQSPIRDYRHDWRYEQDEIMWQDNSPAEIKDVTNEMLDSLEEIAEYDSSDVELQSKFHKLLLEHRTVGTFGAESQVGREFLRKYANLL